MTDPEFTESRATEREYSFAYMLPEETRIVQEWQDERQFFKEQFYKEVRRVISDNAEVVAKQYEHLERILKHKWSIFYLMEDGLSELWSVFSSFKKDSGCYIPFA